MHLTFTMSEAEGHERRIRAAAGLVTSEDGKIAAGGGLRECIVLHLEGMGPNRRFPEATTGFYREAAESTTAPEVTDDGVTISIIKEGMRQRLLGGQITQNTPGKTYLTIPAQGFAYGRLAAEFTGDVKFAFVRNPEGYLMPALIAGEGGAGVSGMKAPRRKKGQSPKPPISPDEVIFWLVHSVFQEPDPTILPTEEEMSGAVVASLTSFLRERLSDPNATVEITEGN